MLGASSNSGVGGISVEKTFLNCSSLNEINVGFISAVQACSSYRSNNDCILTVGTANINKLENIRVKLKTLSEGVTDYNGFSFNANGKHNADIADSKFEYIKPFEVCQSTDEGAMTIDEYVALKKWKIA